MFCNLKDDGPNFSKMARCEVLLFQNQRVQAQIKNKKGEIVTYWFEKNQLANFRYLAWYNGIKIEYQIAKKLAKMGTILYNLTGQDFNLNKKFEIPEIKKIIDQIRPLADYYEKKNANDRSR